MAQDQAEGLQTRALVLFQHGQIRAEAYASGITPDTPLMGWSMGKSLTALMLGWLEQRGQLSVEEERLFDEWSQDERASIQIKDLLQMASGLDFSEVYVPGSDATRMLFMEPSAASVPLQSPLKYPPGTRFSYSSGTTNLLSLLFTQRVGGPQNAINHLYQDILWPMGMHDTTLEPDASGVWKGFDIDFCRATAAAVLGDANKIEAVTSTGKTRFTKLNAGEGDVLWRNTTITFSRDVGVKLRFHGVNYYDGQGFMVKKSLGVKSTTELDGASVCIQTGTTTELNVSDYFRSNGLKYTPITFDTSDESAKSLESGRCDVLTSDKSQLFAQRSKLASPKDYVVLPETISKEPLGPVVRNGDDEWLAIVRWVGYAMLNAEEAGITSKNVEAEAKSTKNPDVARLLGADGEYGKDLKVKKDWVVQIVKQVGNYGEVFERNLGKSTPLEIDRGLNALWNNGGIQYAPPVR